VRAPAPSHGRPPTAVTSFTEWLAAHADGLGVEWASELGRRYR
jgi:hypothetical protein